MIGIREVARKANLSPSIVFRVLNHDETISQKAAAESYYKELQVGLKEEARRLHLVMNRI